jgi:transposase
MAPASRATSASVAALAIVLALRSLALGPATRHYIARRVAEGKSTREATRVLKRYLARHLHRVMQNATPLPT